MGRILVGVSSWSDQSLVKSGRFYPPGVTTAAGRIGYYSGRFGVTEIDSSFYAMPMARSIATWVSGTPSGFQFDVKAYRLLTGHPAPASAVPAGIRTQTRLPVHGPHLYLRHLFAGAADQLWQVFARSIRPLRQAGRLGAVLFQFPPWFLCTQENLDHLAECRSRLRGYPLAIEFRNGSWLNEQNREATLAFFREHTLSLVCVDGPQGFPSSMPPLAEVTAPLAAVRFHGRNAAAWEAKGAAPGEKFRYLYREEELREWAPGIRRLAEQADEVHVIFKNKHEDYPVRNALMMMGMLGLALPAGPTLVSGG